MLVFRSSLTERMSEVWHHADGCGNIYGVETCLPGGAQQLSENCGIVAAILSSFGTLRQPEQDWDPSSKKLWAQVASATITTSERSAFQTKAQESVLRYS